MGQSKLFGSGSELGLLSKSDITKVAVDKFTLSTETYSVKIPHSLGVTPKFALISCDSTKSQSEYVW